MKWPWQKEAPKVQVEPQEIIFSTDWDVRNKQNAAIRRQKALATTWQKGVESVCATGTMDSALDSQYNNLSAVKLRSASYGAIPDAQLAYFAGQGFIGWQAAALLSQNWLIDKACTMPAKDASRHGYEITVNDGTNVNPEVLEYIKEQDKLFKVLPNCVEFVRSGRIFGIRVALFEVLSADPEYYTKPFNIDGVTPKSYKGISQIDPYWMSPLLDLDASSNMASQHFYEPTWWIINGVKVHRTHLVIFRTCDLPDILKPTYIYGSIPIPQRIAERVFAAELTANEAPRLAMSKRLTVVKLDISKAMANPEGLEQQLGLFNQYQNNFGVKVVDQTDEIQQFDTSLADLDAVIMTQYQIVAAASGVPATKLLGTSPKGFNASGDYEEASYHEELESIQQHDLSPLVDRHHELLIKSHVCPKFGMSPFNTQINWLPVDAPTAAELADINLKKAQTDAQYVEMGAIDGVDVRERIIADKDSGHNGIEPITESLINEEVINSDNNA
jgi:uncharacterized protein